MTSQEARDQLDACESQIAETYSNLQKAARNVGDNALQAASGKTTANTLLPLVISLIGIILTYVYNRSFWGTILLVVGIVISYNARGSAMSCQHMIESARDALNMTLDQNSKI